MSIAGRLRPVPADPHRSSGPSRGTRQRGMNVLDTLGDHVTDQRRLRRIARGQPDYFAMRRIGFVLVLGGQRPVDEANGGTPFQDMSLDCTDVQLGKTSIRSHGDTRAPPHLVELPGFATFSKAPEPVDGQSRIVPAKTKRRAVYASFFKDLPGACVANDMIPIGQVLAVHMFTRDARSNASI